MLTLFCNNHNYDYICSLPIVTHANMFLSVS